MADNVTANAGAGGATFATDDDGTAHWPYAKVAWGADNTQTRVAAGAGALPVQDGGNSLTVDGTVTADAGTGPWPVTDNSGSLTVDGTVSISGAVDTELTTADLDTGAGTDTRAVVGLVGSASGGGALIPGSATDGLLVNLGANNDVTVTGTVTVDASGTAVPVTDNAGSLTVDNAALSVVGGGVEATALRVTLASDSTGVVSVDDNGGALTVDGTVTANLAAGTNNIGDVDVLTIAAGDNNIGNVDIVTMPNVTLAAGTNTNEVVGDVAHDAAVAGNPILIGLEARNTEPTAVSTTGDLTRPLATMLGKQVQIPYSIPASSWTYASPAAVTDTADDEAKAAAGAGIRNYITGVQVFNGHDTVGTEVVIKDGSTVLWRGWAEQTGGGCSARFDPPLRGTANTAVNVANITTGSSTYFNLQGFVAAE
jgi:hypothetical protein